jgi:hypothetical protein
MNSIETFERKLIFNHLISKVLVRNYASQVSIGSMGKCRQVYGQVLLKMAQIGKIIIFQLIKLYFFGN